MSVRKSGVISLTALATALLLPASALGTPQFRDTDLGVIADSPLGDAATVGDRYAAVLVPDSQAVMVLDVVTWDFAATSLGVTAPNVCKLSGVSHRPNAVASYESATGELVFFIACDGGVVSTLKITEGTAATSTVTVETAQHSGTTLALVDVAYDAHYGRVLFLDSAGTVHRSDPSAPETRLDFVSAVGTGTPVAVAAPQQGSTGSTVAVAFSSGAVVFIEPTGGVLEGASTCDFAVTDIAPLGESLLVALDSGSAASSLAVIDLALPSGGCQNPDGLQGLIARPARLGLSESASAADDAIYVSGQDPASGDAVVVGPISPDAITASSPPATIDTVDAPDEPGALAPLSAEEGIVIHAGTGDGSLDVLSDAPFITATIKVNVADTSDTATPTPSGSSSSDEYEQSIDVDFQVDEGGDYVITLDGDEADSGDAVEGSSCCTATLDATSLSEGRYELVISVTDTADNVGSRTFYISLDSAPDALDGFSGGFGDGKLILTWDTPSADDITAYELIMFAAAQDDGQPWANADAFLASAAGDAGGATFMVGGASGSRYPDVLGSASWPATVDVDDDKLEVGRKAVTLTISPLDNASEEDGRVVNPTVYYAAVRAVDASGNTGSWSAVVSAIPQKVCGAACVTGEQGGLCAIVASSGPGRWGDRLLAAALLTLVALRRRRTRLVLKAPRGRHRRTE